MSAEQCDVRQSILRRRGRYDEAEKCIQAALAKNPEKAHTRGLLRVGLAKIYRHKGNWRGEEEEIRVAITEAAEAERQDPRQAARIYRHCATAYLRFKQGSLAQQLLEQAKYLARATGARDQLLKM